MIIPIDYARCRRDAWPDCVLCRGLGVVETIHPDDVNAYSVPDFSARVDPRTATIRKVQRVCECVK